VDVNRDTIRDLLLMATKRTSGALRVSRSSTTSAVWRSPVQWLRLPQAHAGLFPEWVAGRRIDLQRHDRVRLHEGGDGPGGDRRHLVPAVAPWFEMRQAVTTINNVVSSTKICHAGDDRQHAEARSSRLDQRTDLPLRRREKPDIALTGTFDAATWLTFVLAQTELTNNRWSSGRYGRRDIHGDGRQVPGAEAGAGFGGGRGHEEINLTSWYGSAAPVSGHSGGDRASQLGL